jgi:hypothetical protein
MNPSTLNAVVNIEDFQHDLEENINNVIKSTEEIINDDFDYQGSKKANSKNYSLLNSGNPQTPAFFIPSDIKQGNTNSSEAQKPQFLYAKSPFFFQENPFCEHEYRGKSENSNRSKPAEKIKNIMNENNIHKAIIDMASQNGIKITLPLLKLEAHTSGDYELEENDTMNLFSRYGKVLKVIVKKQKQAYIIFNDIISALYAQKSLNGHYLKEIDVQLSVDWCNSIEEDEINAAQFEELFTSKLNTQDIIDNWNRDNTKNPYRSLPNLPPGMPTFPYIPIKFTCKYEIQIENDRDFQVARKIIGPKGCNMKKIIEICQNYVKNPSLIYQNDFLKLRLRGKGSGFKEGPDQRESEEPMHLCVSSKYLEVYNMACQLVEELLNNLYREYDNYCRKSGRKFHTSLKIKRIEAFGGTQNKLNNEVKTPENNKENYVNKVKGNLWPSFNSTEIQEQVNEANSIYTDDSLKMKNIPKFNEEEVWKILQLRGINGFEDKMKLRPKGEISDKFISPYEENI